MKDPPNFKLVKYFWLYYALKKQFLFLLTLRTSAAEVCKKKYFAQNHILPNPQDSYKGSLKK